MSRCNVALLFGGRSAEHEISVISARAIAAVIDREKYTVKPVYISHEGRWYGGSAAADVLGLDMATLLRTTSVADARKHLSTMLAGFDIDHFDFTAFQHDTDIAFITLHGSYGEDGKIQGFLETLGIPYTGCGVTASALAMDKALTKLCASSAGLDVADYMVILSNDYHADKETTCNAVAGRFGFPVFVKPANLGSSVGISKVRHAGELKAALDTACSLDSKVLVETAIEGREIEVAVLGNDLPLASVPGEIVPGSEFYDFEDKYVRNDARLFIPAELSAEITRKIRTAAVLAFKALGCSGMSRIDFFLENATGRIILNEINTIPGFTDISMYSRMLAATGIGFPQLVEKLLLLALEKTLPIDKL
jgi:D-alanine-D-alanine ligase